ncbi:MAG: hypothetical protein ACK46O_06020, partial [Flavobacteriia bacterium]
MKRIIQIAVLMTIFTACQRNDVQEILNKKKTIVDKTKNTSLLKRTTLLIFKTKNESGEINEYYYQVEGSNISFFRDTLNYDSEFYNNQKLNQTLLDSRVKDYNNFLRDYHIESYSSDFSNKGVELKFYLTEGGVLLYVPELNLLKDDIYKKYIE